MVCFLAEKGEEIVEEKKEGKLEDRTMESNFYDVKEKLKILEVEEARLKQVLGNVWGEYRKMKVDLMSDLEGKIRQSKYVGMMIPVKQIWDSDIVSLRLDIPTEDEATIPSIRVRDNWQGELPKEVKVDFLMTEDQHRGKPMIHYQGIVPDFFILSLSPSQFCRYISYLETKEKEDNTPAKMEGDER